VGGAITNSSSSECNAIKVCVCVRMQHGNKTANVERLSWTSASGRLAGGSNSNVRMQCTES
jgi:hypothetical protein